MEKARGGGGAPVQCGARVGRVTGKVKQQKCGVGCVSWVTPLGSGLEVGRGAQ